MPQKRVVYLYPLNRWVGWFITVVFIFMGAASFSVLCYFFGNPGAPKPVLDTFSYLHSFSVFRSRFYDLQAYDGRSGYFYFLVLATFPVLVFLFSVTLLVLNFLSYLFDKAPVEFRDESGMLGWRGWALTLFLIFVLFIQYPMINPKHSIGYAIVVTGYFFTVMAGGSYLLISGFLFVSMQAAVQILAKRWSAK